MKRIIALPVLLSALTIATFASINVSAPTNGATVKSPVNIVASAQSRNRITGMVIYVDSKKVYSTGTGNLNTSIAMSSGQHAIVVKAWNSQGRSYSDWMTVQVAGTASVPPPTPPPTPAALKLTTSSLPSGTKGSSYSATLQATGGTVPYSWGVASGSLPAGLILSSGGIISGTPSASGNFGFTVQAKDSSASPLSASGTENISVVASSTPPVATPLSISTTSMPGATAGVSYSTTLAAKGGTSPYTWSLISGQLPAGLTLAASGGIVGVPTASGSFTFTADVKDAAAGSASWSESLSVAAAPALSITSATSLAGAKVGSAYTATLAAKGGIPPYTWSVASGVLPGGVKLSSAGLISGTPTASGNFTFTAQANDSAATSKSATQAEGIAVAAASTTTAQATPPPQAAGYSLKFSDDFASLNMSPNREGAYNWYEGIWWNSNVSPASDITVSNSTLNLNWVNGHGTGSTDVSACSQSGANCHTFRYGYFEASMKWDATTGSWPAFWLIPVQGITDPTGQHGEIDVFEGQGTDNTYYATIHDWNNNSDVFNNNSTNAHKFPSTIDLSQFHTYGILWVPGTISWYLDNQLLTSAKTDGIFDVQDYYPVFSSQEGINWSEGDTTGVTASTIPLNVAWINIFQK